MGEYKANKNGNEEDAAPQMTAAEKRHDATKKAADLGATAYLDAHSGGLASKLKNVPGVKGVWDKTMDRAAKKLEKTPVGDVAEKLDKSGITDAAGTAYSAYQGAKNGNMSGGSKSFNSPQMNKSLNPSIQGVSNKNKAASNVNKSNEAKSNNAKVDSDLIKKILKSKIPLALKIKIIVVLSVVLLCIIIFSTIVVASKDYANIDLTNGSENSFVDSSSPDNIDNENYSGSNTENNSSKVTNSSASNQSNSTTTTSSKSKNQSSSKTSSNKKNTALSKLFPNGIPSSKSEMSKYMTTISVQYNSSNGSVQSMNLTVHKDVVNDITSIFNKIQSSGFVLKPATTGCYSYRKMTGKSTLSYHSYGIACDLNWDDNPYCTKKSKCYNNPPTGTYAITSNGPVVAAFKSQGWKWGGDWSSSKDYMHFSLTGN